MGEVAGAHAMQGAQRLRQGREPVRDSIGGGGRAPLAGDLRARGFDLLHDQRFEVVDGGGFSL